MNLIKKTMNYKILLFLITTVLFRPDTSKKVETYVYICKGGGKKFHLNKDCRGLKKCNRKIEKVTITRAKNIGRSLCKYEN